jgi:uncharacterized protein
MTQVPVSEGVFTWPSDAPHLIGSKCLECGTHTFPVATGCSRCSSDRLETVELSRRGKLWTWTIQGFPPKAPPFAGNADPKTFKPFGVGYVELPGEVKVETRLTVSDPSQLQIGMEMELVIEPLTTDDDGNEVVTFAFAPVGAS